MEGKKIKLESKIIIISIIFLIISAFLGVILGLIVRNNNGNNNGTGGEYTTNETFDYNSSIDYLKQKYDLEREVKYSAKLSSISTFTITKENMTVKNSGKNYCDITIKGNCIGYKDEYNTQIMQYIFTITAKVYEDGKIKDFSVNTDKAR